METQLNMKNVRIHLEDKGQDLIYVEVKMYDEKIGRIVDLPQSCSSALRDIYINKAFNVNDNQVGVNFNYAVPNEGFKVYQNDFKVKSIEFLN